MLDGSQLNTGHSGASSASARDGHGLAPSVAGALLKRRSAVAEAFARAAGVSPRWATAIENAQDRWLDFVELEFASIVDYLIRYYESGDQTFRTLVIGEKIKSLYDPAYDPGARRRLAADTTAAEVGRVRTALRDVLDSAGLQRIEDDLRSIGGLLSNPTAKEKRVLLVGDCLFLDVVPFATADLLEHGVSLVADYAASKHPVQLLDEIRSHGATSYDLVFFSPLSYDFSADFSAILEWRRAVASAGSITATAEGAWRDAARVLDLLADNFDCPIYIHNTGAVVREADDLKRAVKLRLTTRTRRLAREVVNGLIVQGVAKKNEASYQHVFVLDEETLVRKAGEAEAGRYLHWSPLQHPAMLGRILARHYVNIVYADTFLISRKVVVSDLDNTLWDGVIGEGAVEHFHNRQRQLKALKERGVVLAINSKNDPANVHWRGGTLQDIDFVCAAISWEPKTRGMRQIQDALNVKTKDFVFIDDREDELALMKAAHPDVICLDATDPETWERLALWCERLDEHPEMDRTLMYQQRDERKAFAREDAISDAEKAEIYAALQLSVKVEEAERGDLKRCAELINRTSQFNLEGSRVTFQQVAAWHSSPSHIVVLGRSADRFGSMGTTCVAAARLDGSDLELLPFVLSCRVFGYGIETVVMNALKTFAARRGATRIVGRFVPTAQNAPCKDFLAQSGFAEESGRWVFSVGSGPLPDPSWLRVTSRMGDA